MTLSQTEFVKNYLNLISQVDKNDLGKVIRFCSLFNTDDIELYNKFKNSSQSSEDVINLYAERYDLDSQNDIEEIMYAFIQNAINNGVSYHLNSSANRSSILNMGLGTSAIGIKTEERSDYERLEEITSSELFNKLEPFHGDKKGSKVYYSNKPILNARYGKMPEWIQELKINSDFVDFGEEQEAKKFVDEILKKYEKKYFNKGRDILILPYLGKKISEDEVEQLLKRYSPKDIIGLLYRGVLNSVDEYYTSHISGTNIISIDLENLNLYFMGRNGEIETRSPFEKNGIQLSSEFDMQEVFLGNTGRMYQIDDKNDGKEYYFKPAISKIGQDRPYRAYIQEAAYHVQKIINPDNAVTCNTIEIDGMFGAIQEKIQVDSIKTQSFINYFNNGEGELSPEIISQIMNEYLVDFCLCNYDSHAKNFVIDKDGKLRGIDKEQSFRYIEEDQNEDMMFSTNYNQKYGERPSIYNILFEKMKQGKISCEYLEELLFRVGLVEQIPNVQYRQIFEEYAYRKTGNPKDAEILLDRIIDRKNNISEKVEQLVNELYNESSKNKLAQADNPQRDSIPLQDMVKNAICSGVSLENINEYDMSSKGNEQEYKKVRNEEI